MCRLNDLSYSRWQLKNLSKKMKGKKKIHHSWLRSFGLSDLLKINIFFMESIIKGLVKHMFWHTIIMLVFRVLITLSCGSIICNRSLF